MEFFRRLSTGEYLNSSSSKVSYKRVIFSNGESFTTTGIFSSIPVDAVLHVYAPLNHEWEFNFLWE